MLTINHIFIFILAGLSSSSFFTPIAAFEQEKKAQHTTLVKKRKAEDQLTSAQNPKVHKGHTPPQEQELAERWANALSSSSEQTAPTNEDEKKAAAGKSLAYEAAGLLLPLDSQSSSLFANRSELRGANPIFLIEIDKSSGLPKLTQGCAYSPGATPALSILNQPGYDLSAHPHYKQACLAIGASAIKTNPQFVSHLVCAPLVSKKMLLLCDHLSTLPLRLGIRKDPMIASAQQVSPVYLCPGVSYAAFLMSCSKLIDYLEKCYPKNKRAMCAFEQTNGLEALLEMSWIKTVWEKVADDMTEEIAPYFIDAEKSEQLGIPEPGTLMTGSLVL